MNPGTVAVGYLDPDTWSACFGMSLRDLMLCDATNFHRLVPNGRELRNVCAAGGVVDGRNQVVARFLDDTPCEWLWFIDSDMGFAPDTVESLIASADPTERPVVGALCFGLKKEAPGEFYSSVFDTFPTVYDWFEDDTVAGFVHRVDYPRDALQPVAATGAACILIHRSALDAIRARDGDRWFDPIRHPKQPKGFSEDLSFCIRLAQVGIEVWVDTSVKTTHHKGGIYLDETAWDRQVRAVAAESEAFFRGLVNLLGGPPARALRSVA